MAEELQVQALFDRIEQEALKKADSDRAAIVEEAKRDAAGIRQQAQSEAERIVADARREANMLVDKGRESLKHAARDTMLSLRRQLEQRVRNIVSLCVAEGMTATTISEIIVALAKAYVQSGKDLADIQLLLNDKQQSGLLSAVKARLGQELNGADVAFAPAPGMEAGFRVRVAGDEVTYDFSDEALTDILCSFLNPKFAEMIRE